MDSGMQDTAGSTAAERPAKKEEAATWPGHRTRLSAFVLFVLGVLLAGPSAHHARAASLLMAFSDANAKVAATEEVFDFDVPPSPHSPARKVKARLFTPPGRTAAEVPAIVLVHGVQYLGIEEPRLQRFARSIVGAGIAVMTPQIDELADYHVAPASIDTTGAAIEALRARSGHAKVGLMGTSFGGGVALLTAGDPRFADRVSFVVSVGAHDDLARVSRFFATNEIETTNGATESLHAHEYGATILVYTHADRFFPAEDLPAARDALRLWIWEKQEAARAEAKKTSPETQAKLAKLFAADIASVRPELLAELERLRPEMDAVSPHGHLGGIKAHVYLLHGQGDTVIPATEAAWLAKDVPPASLRAVVVSPALVHVDLDKPSLSDRWQLVHFMGRVIGEAEDGG